MDQKPRLPSQSRPELPPPLPHPVLAWRQHDDVTRLKETHRLPGEVTLWACSSQARPGQAHRPFCCMLLAEAGGLWPLGYSSSSSWLSPPLLSRSTRTLVRGLSDSEAATQQQAQPQPPLPCARERTGPTGQTGSLPSASPTPGQAPSGFSGALPFVYPARSQTGPPFLA